MASAKGNGVKICISGLTGSGKTTIAGIVAKKLGYPLISLSYKDFAKNVVEFAKENINNKNLAKSFDGKVAEMAEKEKNCVVSTWLGPWVVKGCIKIWLYTDLDTRIKRIAEREKISIKKAKEYIKEKDDAAIKHFKKVYNINVLDHENFDLILNTSNLPKEKVADIIVCFIKAKTSRRRK